MASQHSASASSENIQRLQALAAENAQLLQTIAAENAQLLQTIAETKHAEQSLKQHTKILACLNKQITTTTAPLEHLSHKTTSALRHHTSYSNSVIRRSLGHLSGSLGITVFTLRALKHESRYRSALSAETAAKTSLANLETLKAEAVAHKTELHDAILRHGWAEADLDSLHDAIFSGPTHDHFPREHAQKQRLAHAQKAFKEATRQAMAARDVVSLFRTARRTVHHILNHLQTPRHPCPLSNLHHREQHRLDNNNSLRELRQHVAEAARTVRKAYTLDATISLLSPLAFSGESDESGACPCFAELVGPLDIVLERVNWRTGRQGQGVARAQLEIVERVLGELVGVGLVREERIRVELAGASQSVGEERQRLRVVRSEVLFEACRSSREEEEAREGLFR